MEVFIFLSYYLDDIVAGIALVTALIVFKKTKKMVAELEESLRRYLVVLFDMMGASEDNVHKLNKQLIDEVHDLLSKEHEERAEHSSVVRGMTDEIALMTALIDPEISEISEEDSDKEPNPETEH